MPEGSVYFADGEGVSMNKDSIGKDLNATGPGSLSAGGPVDTPSDYAGRSADYSSPSGNVPGGGEVEGPADVA